jgi:hypothetical protein
MIVPRTFAMSAVGRQVPFSSPGEAHHALREPEPAVPVRDIRPPLMDVMVTIPDGTDPDGAVVELYEHGGHLHAEVRIPPPQE